MSEGKVYQCFMLEWTGRTLYAAIIVDPWAKDGCISNNGGLHARTFPITEPAHTLAVNDKLNRIRKMRHLVPKYCACGHSFACGQVVNAQKGPELRDTRDGSLSLGCPKGAYGATWDAPWLKDRVFPGDEIDGMTPDERVKKIALRAHDDGKIIVVNTPAGEWLVDGPMASGEYWTRNGDPPELTVRPAFVVKHDRDTGALGWNGFLENGFLIPSQVVK